MRMQNDGSAIMAYYYFDFKDLKKRDVRGLLSLNYVITLALAGMSFPRCIRNVVMDRHSPARPCSQIVCKICLGTLEKTRFMLLSMHWMNAPMLREHHPPAKGPHVFERTSWEHKFEFTYIDHDSGVDRSKTYNNLLTLSHLAPTVCLSTRKADKERISWNISVHLFTMIHTCGDGGRMIKKLLSVHSLNEPREYETPALRCCWLLLTLSHRFRWVYCQLDTLRRCMPSGIRKALNNFPITLNDTYTRALGCISREKWRHAHRLFQCLIAAIRPLRVEDICDRV
jgi:hypothetical protein